MTEGPDQRLGSSFMNRTGWEWLHLVGVVAVPVMIFFGGLWFNEQQEARQQDIEEQRADSEQHVEEQRAQDEALQSYLDQMSGLLLYEGLGDPVDLDNSEASNETVRTLARARTLTVLESLDPSRKGEVIRFLVSARLIQRQEDPKVECQYRFQDPQDPPPAPPQDRIIDLIRADPNGASLNFAYLAYIDLSDTYMSNADLSESNLCNANLSNVDLSGANLRIADLRDANLSSSNLTDADLTDADLRGAVGITNEELEQQARSLEGATMPDGLKHP